MNYCALPLESFLLNLTCILPLNKIRRSGRGIYPRQTFVTDSAVS
jgi:hypothetical protein